MLGRAVTTSSTAPKQQKPLRPNPAAANTSRPIESNKRKFDRTMSSTSGRLGALHESSVFYNENDFDDDDVIDLDGSLPPSLPKADVQYPSLNRAVSNVNYPALPQLPNKSLLPSSSATVPWSSSPPEHFQKRALISIHPRSPGDVENEAGGFLDETSKRRKLPWPLHQHQKDETFTPLPKNKSNADPYAWNKTASAVKKEQKEFRKNNFKARPTPKLSVSKLDPKGLHAPFLSDEQKAILKTVVDDGKSVFFTGSAGTGKSVLMRAIIAKFRDKYRREADRIAVTASTGLAACVIEGVTLHSFAGIGIGREAAPELIKKIKRNATHKQRWQKTKVLIIDEISMVDGDLFDKLEQIARALRGNGKPFGGIQLVVTGDFFQLPPVPERNSIAKFAFEAATWNTSIAHTILLTHVFRQKDPVFANMLNEIRLGKLTPATIRAFQQMSRQIDFGDKDKVECTELFPTRNEVENANGNRMKNLIGETRTFRAIDSGAQEPIQRAKTLSNFMAQEVLTLKKGAQVMLIKNIDGQLANGLTGKVVGFMNENDFRIYQDNEEMYHLSYESEKDGNEERNEKIRNAKEIIQGARYKNETPGNIYPLVRFTLQDNTSRDLLCSPEEFKTDGLNGEIAAKRVQVPLILAWALSIHKAQGQTLERVKVNLGKIFEKGQAYVALSRATNQSGLIVHNFDARKVMVHPKVVDFYKNLVSITAVLEKDNQGGATAISAAEFEDHFVNDDYEELSMHA